MFELCGKFGLIAGTNVWKRLLPREIEDGAHGIHNIVFLSDPSPIIGNACQ